MNRKTEDKNQKLRKATKQLRKKNPKTDQVFKSKDSSNKKIEK